MARMAHKPRQCPSCHAGRNTGASSSAGIELLPLCVLAVFDSCINELFHHPEPSDPRPSALDPRAPAISIFAVFHFFIPSPLGPRANPHCVKVRANMATLVRATIAANQGETCHWTRQTPHQLPRSQPLASHTTSTASVCELDVRLCTADNVAAASVTSDSSSPDRNT